MRSDEELIRVNRGSALEPDALSARRRTAAENGHQQRGKGEETSRTEDEMCHVEAATQRVCRGSEVRGVRGVREGCERCDYLDSTGRSYNRVRRTGWPWPSTVVVS